MRVVENLIDIHPNTRSGQPQIPIGIVIHWMQAPGWTAARSRAYFNSLPRTEPTRFASCHYVVGLDGEIIQLIPDLETAWHAGPSSQTKRETLELLGGKPNWRTIGIELCHPDLTGEFRRETLDSALELTADKMREFDIIPDRILRHYDCTGKNCPKWFVDHPDEWEVFKKVAKRMAGRH